MQRLPEDEQTTIRSQIELLSEQDISDRAKVLSLGLLLMNAVGEAVLRAAVRSLDDTIRPRRGTS